MTRRLLPLVVVAVVFLNACSDDDTSAPPTTPIDPPTTTSTPTTEPDPSTTPSPTSPSPTTSRPTTEPTTTDPVELEPTLQDLLDRYDVAVAAILSDPRVAADPAHPAVVAYLDLFAADSSFAQGALVNWVNEGERGRFYRPGPRGELIDSTLREVTDASDDEVSFTACVVNSMEVVDGAGTVVEARGGVTFVEAVAVRIDDQWVLRDLTQAGGDCPRPGASG